MVQLREEKAYAKSRQKLIDKINETFPVGTEVVVVEAAGKRQSRGVVAWETKCTDVGIRYHSSGKVHRKHFHSVWVWVDVGQDDKPKKKAKRVPLPKSIAPYHGI